MDINLIKRLIKIVEQSDIKEFSVQEGELKVKISKTGSNSAPIAYHTVEAPRQAAAPSSPAQGTVTHVEVSQTSAPAPSNMHEIRSPIVGTFYRSPSPDTEAFVKVGDTIEQGKILCIVEAMKLMNEIEADVNGKIVKILVENGMPVEYNQPLFLVEKA